MRILKALVIAAIYSAPIAYAAITMKDIDNASFRTQDAIGSLQACSIEFPDIKVSQITTKLDSALHRLINASHFDSSNFDEVHSRKIWLNTTIVGEELKGRVMSEPKLEVMKWCGNEITEAEKLTNYLDTKIRSESKVKNKNTNVADDAKMRTRRFALKLTLLFTNTNTTDPHNMLKKVPVSQSFESEDECRTYLSWRMTNTEPGILGGAWVPHPSGKQIVCEEQ